MNGSAPKGSLPSEARRCFQGQHTLHRSRKNAALMTHRPSNILLFFFSSWLLSAIAALANMTFNTTLLRQRRELTND